MFSKKDPVKKHQAISDDAFSLFNDTVRKLQAADEGIQEDIDATQDAINAAVVEQDALLLIRKRNADLNKKISKFFGS
tara:strand:+ start:1228 stop:1461 length:234 start_codon:yes stop_codon:yes gene_type:complete